MNSFGLTALFFIAYGASTLQKLDEYIRSCDAVIHICGDMTGSMTNALSLDYINNAYKDFGTLFFRAVTCAGWQSAAKLYAMGGSEAKRFIFMPL